jgi:sugar lactone lactonase YvrE
MSTPRIFAVLFLILAGALSAQAQTISILASSTPLNNPFGLAADSAGNLFVANGVGPGGFGATVLKIAPGGAVSTVFTEAGDVFQQGLALDESGNFFIALTNNQIIKVTPGGTASAFVDSNAGVRFLTFITVDGAGNLYFVSEQPGGGGNAVSKVTPDGAISAFPGNHSFGMVGGIAADAAGNIFVANVDSGTIDELSPSGASSTFVPATTGNFPGCLTFDGAGNLFVSYLTHIDKITPGGTVSTFDTHVIEPLALAAKPDGSLAVLSQASNSVSSVSVGDVVTVIATSSLNTPKFTVFDSAGNLVVGTGDNTIVKISPAGAISTFVDASQGLSRPAGLAFDANGNLFVANGNIISKVTPSGAVSTFVDDSQGLVIPAGLAFDAAGNLFVSNYYGNSISEVTPAGSVSTFVDTPAGLSTPDGLAFDHNGNLFVSNFSTGAISKVTPAGATSTVASDSVLLGAASGLAFDANGNLFVAVDGISKVIEITPAGDISAALPNDDSTAVELRQPVGLAFDNAGRLAIADASTFSILRATFGPSPLAAAVLPGARAVQVGSPATIFATLVNAGTSDLDNCGVHLVLATSDVLSFGFQTTDPATNALTGTAMQPVRIPAGKAQTFLLSFQSSAPLGAIELAPEFLCDNVTPAPATIGVDTVDLLFSAAPTADIIALALSSTNDGVLHIQQGVGAFAVASIDAGAAATLTVSPDTGSATLPLGLSVCQTTSAGQCVAAPAASLPVSFTPGATPTFSVFASTTAAIPFAPGTSRIFLRFADASGVSHGSTSVAVTTH